MLRCCRWLAFLCPAIVIATILLAVDAAPCAAQPDDDDEEALEFVPGLVAEYTGPGGANVERLDDAISFVWPASRADVRLAEGPFAAQWRGRLFTIAPGTYRLYVYVSGTVRVSLNGQVVIDGQNDEPAWLAAQPMELAYGYHPLEITYRTGDGLARLLGLYWEGPQFEREPIAPRWLFHDPAATVDTRFERGRELVQALRCAACHQLNGAGEMLSAPALDRLGENIQPSWVVERLSEPLAQSDEDSEDDSARRMPAFKLSREEATAVAAYLAHDATEVNKNFAAVLAKAKDQPPAGDAEAGQRLFQSIGCLGCHRVDNLGTGGLFAGSNLTCIADKRPAGFFSHWLADPAAINREHRMPRYGDGITTNEERRDLGAYLATLRDPSQGSTTVEDLDQGGVSQEMIDRGHQLSRTFRCHHCHSLPEPEQHGVDLVGLVSSIDWQQSCAARSEPRESQPAFGLRADEVEAIEVFWNTIEAIDGSEREHLDGHWIWTSHNCRGCHARDLEPGIAPRLPALAEADAELAPLLPAMEPPSLSGIGDKLEEDKLAEAVRGLGPRRRPWLAIRMPKFRALDEEHAEALASYFVAADRMPPWDREKPTTDDETALVAAGGRLVSSAGFGCTSCHALGSSEPAGVALAAHGSDLSQIDQRIRKPWFDRWVRNPSRIVPQMEMPSIQLPVHGVLGDDVDRQLAAVWHVLTLEDFDPPQPNPIRVVRLRNEPATTETASVLTDVIEWGDRVFVKPLVIGLSNRHNVLFDLDALHVAGWWLGDTAMQRTRGKTWYWEPGGTHLLEAADEDAELALVSDSGDVAFPIRWGQFLAELDGFEKIFGGVQFSVRVRFAVSASEEPVVLRVAHSIIATPEATVDGEPSGFLRRMEVQGIPDGWSLRWRVIDDEDIAADATPSADGRSLNVEAELGHCELQILAPSGGRFEEGDAAIVLEGHDDGSAFAEVACLSDVPVDRYLVTLPAVEPPPAAVLDLVPGFEAVRLPLPGEFMPTGLAWRDDGTLIVTSLKGRVWLAHDTDGDGLEDRLEPFSDELAAPFGAAAHGDAIDVINKYALLRLHDDGDGRAERTEVLASGWGHTDDYHDWAIGLPRDKDGNYYVGLPCQQDDRSTEAAHLRGRAVRLVPREPTADDPRPYGIEAICAGLRFPTGLALSREEELFATDNQGNYNPFNELNHLLPGERYGFINKLEAKPGFKPPWRDPAVNIPHPWTRSVNGIGFLDTPTALRERLGSDLFGPFEGHLLGCEYDDRKMVRISLEPAGDSFQGAVYPFSLPEPPDGETFEGPLVCQVAPDGDIYLGNLRDSGWGAGANTGSIVRLRSSGEWPLGIAEVHAAPDGFVIEFTAPIDAEAAGLDENYSVSSYRRESTPIYGGPDLDRCNETIEAIEVGDDLLHVKLRLAELREGFVYELRVGRLGDDDAEPLFPAEAHYTLHHIPQ